MAALSVAFVCGPSLQAAPQTTRFPIDPFVPANPGSFFAFLDDLSKPGGFHERALAMARAKPDAVHAIEDMEIDRLTRFFLLEYESYQSILLQLQALFAIHHRQTLTPEESSKATDLVLLPDGRKESLPMNMALFRTFGFVLLLHDAIRQKPSHAELRGSYLADSKGACPFSKGKLVMRQRDHFLEAVRDDQQLLVGVVGQRRAWFLANEQRYATLLPDPVNGSAVVQAPDAPSELYSGVLHTTGVTLVGELYGRCQLSLKRL